MAVSSPVLNASKDRDCTTFHGNLFQCSFTLTIKNFFFLFKWNFLYFSLYLVSVVFLPAWF